MSIFTCKRESDRPATVESQIGKRANQSMAAASISKPEHNITLNSKKNETLFLVGSGNDI